MATQTAKTYAPQSDSTTAVGFAELLGREVVVICAVYIYTGKLAAVGLDAIKLEQGHIVYETGDWKNKTWTDAQRLPFEYTYVAKCMIESFGAREFR
jgi:hypothetical protein